MKYVVSLDQGTSSSRAIVFDENALCLGVAQKEFTQHFPLPECVEHDPMDILNSQMDVLKEVIKKTGISREDVAALGIANQRETTIVWDATSGKPLYNAIVWQDRRTAQYCEELKKEGYADLIRQKTGLLIDAYFSATKIRWILKNVPHAMERALRGELRFGTVDSWLLWNLTSGKVHSTDVTNASRTMLFNIHTLQWDEELLSIMEIPRSMLPKVTSCSEVFGYVSSVKELSGVPVAASAGDQQAALFGQMCLQKGSVKNTYGTGCFLLMNTGESPVVSKNGLLSTIAWKIGDKVVYAIEGSVFVAGSIVQWLRDGLKIIDSSSEIEALAGSVEDNGGVCFVPALTGLGAPYWDPYAKGLITGITRGTTKAHIARAALEGIAFQTMDIVRAMQSDVGENIHDLKVDGGASRNNLLMQFQSDILNCRVVRPSNTETTALGAAYFAGLAVGVWKSLEQIESKWRVEKEFVPTMDLVKRDGIVSFWEKAVSRTLK